MATKKHPRRKKGRLAIIDEVERLLLGEKPDPIKEFIEEAYRIKRPPSLRYDKDGSRFCPIHCFEPITVRKVRGGRRTIRGKVVRTAPIVYVGGFPYCSGCWEIKERQKYDTTKTWKFAVAKIKSKPRAFLMHRTRPAREQFNGETSS